MVDHPVAAANTIIPAPTAAASLHTMLGSLEGGIEVLQRLMPEIKMFGGFVPGATSMIQLVALALPSIQNAIKFIMEEEGKSPLEAFEDLLRHIGPGLPNSPSLSKPPVVAPANPVGE